MYYTYTLSPIHIPLAFLHSFLPLKTALSSLWHHGENRLYNWLVQCTEECLHRLMEAGIALLPQWSLYSFRLDPGAGPTASLSINASLGVWGAGWGWEPPWLPLSTEDDPPGLISPCHEGVPGLPVGSSVLNRPVMWSAHRNNTAKLLTQTKTATVDWKMRVSHLLLEGWMEWMFLTTFQCTELLYHDC